MKQRITAVLLCAAMAAATLAGCGSKSDLADSADTSVGVAEIAEGMAAITVDEPLDQDAADRSQNDEEETPEALAEPYDIVGTIDYEITEGEDDNGNPCLKMTYTNNTNYPILECGIDFSCIADSAEDLTPSQKMLLLEMLGEDYTFESFFYTSTLVETSFYGYLAPGETSEPEILYHNAYEVSDDGKSYYHRVNRMKYLALADNGSASITYITEDKRYIAFYSFEDQTFTDHPREKGDAYAWFTSELLPALPVPDGHPTIIEDDNEKYCNADVFNVTQDEYEDYINKCIEAGYDEHIDTNDSWRSHHAYIWIRYNEMSSTMHVTYRYGIEN